MEVDRQTVGKIFNHLRNVCTIAIDKPNLKLGGKNRVVEIDDSLIAKVMYMKGKDLKREQIWIYGLVDRSTGCCYLQIVPNRTAKVLLGITYDHTLPHSFINSDKYASYIKLYQLHDESVTHRTVNQTLNFVEPTDGTCTNKVEFYWNACKIKFKQMRGCRRIKIQGYIDEFMWRKNNKFSREDSYQHILKELSKLYSPSTLKEIKIMENNKENIVNTLNTADDGEVNDDCGEGESEHDSEEDTK